MANKMIESMLEESIQTNNKAGLSKLDERKLRQTIAKNDRLLERNKVRFEKEEPRFSTCLMYNPCPICDKCQNKGSHLYKRCETCQIPICVHTYQDRKKMIRRQNFAFKRTKIWDIILEKCDSE